VDVIVEALPREVFLLKDTGTRRHMLRRRPELPRGSASALLFFVTFRRRGSADPIFPISSRLLCTRCRCSSSCVV
jgi:hypothetical protein